MATFNFVLSIGHRNAGPSGGTSGGPKNIPVKYQRVQTVQMNHDGCTNVFSSRNCVCVGKE